jgi:hypothetical protein
MKPILLAAGAVAIAFTASQVLAAPAPASPKQPIPYSQLSAYLKASPKQRASKDWSAAAMASASTAPMPTAGADTGAAANTSAVTPTASLPGDTAAAAPALPANPPIDNPPSTTVNPPASAAPGSPAATTPPK